MTLSDKYHNDCWPKGRHLWLMQAALLEGNLARDAWEKWSQHLDVDNLDYPSYQVIPKLYKNLQKLHVEYPQENVF